MIKQYIKNLLCISLFFLFTTSLYAKDVTIPRHDLTSTLNLDSFDILYLENQSKTLLTDAELQSAKIHSSLINLPAYDAQHWMVFEVHNPFREAREVYLGSNEGFLDEFDLYMQESGMWIHQKNGFVVPMDERSIDSELPMFKIRLKSDETKRLYVRACSDLQLLTFGLVLQDRDAMHRSSIIKLAGYSLFIGAVGIILISNLFLFVSLREKLYFYYVMFGGLFLLFIIEYSAYVQFWNQNMLLRQMMHIPTTLFMIFMILFMRELFEIPRRFKLLDKLLLGLAGICLLIGIFVAIDIHNYKYIVVVGMPLSLTVWGISLYLWFKRVPLVGYFLLGETLYLLGVFTIVGMNFGLIEYSMFSRYSFMVGSLFEIATFSLILAYRVRLLEKENKHIQGQMLLEKEAYAQRLTLAVDTKTKELQRLNSELEELSITDKLTGLYNRGGVDKILLLEYERFQRYKTPFGLIMIDIDYFKKINDTYGHNIGDRVLQEFSKILLENIRDADIAGRWGGEEFMIICNNSNTQSIKQLAEKLRQKVQAYSFSFVPAQTASFGVGIIEEGENLLTFIERVDKYLYTVKESGRNRVVCSF